MNVNIKQLEANLWKAADELREGSKISSNEYFMPVLGLIFLRYAYSRFKKVEAEIIPTLPSRGGKTRAITPEDFNGRSAIFLPLEAQYEYIVNLSGDFSNIDIKASDGHKINSFYEVVNNAMILVENNCEQLAGVLPKNYEILGSDELLKRLIRIFNNSTIDEVGGDVFGRIYEYFLNKFSKLVAQDDGVFFTPKSLVKMIVNIIEPKEGKLLDPACGSGGMFVQTGDFISDAGEKVNEKMTFYGQEKVELNAKICLMNIAVHGLNSTIKSGEQANTFYHDAHNLEGKCDYVMANPPFNVSLVKKEAALSAGRLPFGLPTYNEKENTIGNANYLWIQYFYAYLNNTGRAGFVMASSATDSGNKDLEIRQKLIETGDVDCMLSVANNFFYTKSLPCTLWFFDKGKKAELKDKILFVDARNYYTVETNTINTWSDWQLKNLTAIVWLYRGEIEKYRALIDEYTNEIEHWCKSCNLNVIPDSFAVSKELAQQHLEELQAGIKAQQAELKTIKGKGSKEKKQQVKDDIAILQNDEQSTQDIITTISEALWLTDKFGLSGVYQDVAGLCRIANQEDIKNKKYTLTPGAYVGVAAQKDDGVDFNLRMSEIHDELKNLNKESNALVNEILKNWESIIKFCQ